MENTHLDLTWLWSTLSAAGTGLVTYIFTRRKNTAEAQTNELDNVGKAIEIWRKIAQDLESKYNDLEKRLTEQGENIKKLEHENLELSEQNSELKRTIDELRRQVNNNTL